MFNIFSFLVNSWYVFFACVWLVFSLWFELKFNLLIICVLIYCWICCYHSSIMSQAASLNPLGIEDKIAYTWEIEPFSTLTTRKRSNDFYKTEDGCFILDLILCPPEAHMNVILSYYSAILVIRTNVHCPNSLNVHYTLSLLNKTGQKCDTQEGFATFVDQKMKANWVYPIFLDYVTANGFLVDDKLNLHCEVKYFLLKNSLFSIFFLGLNTQEFPIQDKSNRKHWKQVEYYSERLWKSL